MPILVRGTARFPITGYYSLVFAALHQQRFIDGILQSIQQSIAKSGLAAGITFADVIAGVFFLPGIDGSARLGTRFPY